MGVPLVGGFIIAMLCQKDVLSWYGKKVKKVRAAHRHPSPEPHRVTDVGVLATQPSWCPPNW